MYFCVLKNFWFYSLSASYLCSLQDPRSKWKMTYKESLGYSSDSYQQKLSNEYQYDRVEMVIKKLCVHFWGEESSLINGGVNI